MAVVLTGMPGPRALPLATAIMTCGLAATAFEPALPAALAGLATAGIGWSCFLGTAIAILQSADPRMLGRVMSLFAVVLLRGTSAAPRRGRRSRPPSLPRWARARPSSPAPPRRPERWP
jgi:hypothetical protein